MNYLKEQMVLNKFDLKFSHDSIYFDNLIEDCYKLDKNVSPFQYRLKHLNRLFPNVDFKDRKQKEMVDQVWQKIQKKLGETLRFIYL